MKVRTSLFVPLYAAMALLAVAGCSDDLDNGADGNRPKGNGIVFGASADYVGNPETRTAYGDYDDPDNPTSQEILWLADDRVEVWSPQSPTKTQVEYQITKLGEVTGAAGDEGKAYLASYQGRDGLQWAMNEPTQDFYAVYPSPASITNQEMVQQHRIRLENGVLHGFVPTNQEYTFAHDPNEPGGWKCTPTMDWQYMVARTDNFPVPQDGTDGGINLNFKPLVTTLEITLVGPSAPLAQMNIEAPEGEVIMGLFSCDLKDGETWSQDYLPQCVAEQTGTVTNYVTVNLYDTDQNPITLAEGESLTINVFLLPNKEWTDLQVRLAGYNTASKTLQLEDNGTPIKLSAHQKTRVKIKAPSHIEGTNEWISGLNDDVYVSQLSIPGTANSFSYEYKGQNHDWYAAQTATFDEQWDAGIRCFELKCPQTTGDLGDVVLQCNRTNLGNITFKQAVDMIWQKIQEHPGEFAMIIPAYESDAGHGGNAVREFAEALNRFYRNNANDYDFITYGRNVTVGDARGKLMFVARITSEEDENSLDDITPEQGVIVKGWGSLKDLWARRGYSAPNWGDKNNDFGASIEYLMVNGNRSQNYTFTMPTGGKENFMHTTIREDGSTGTAYIQDWNRVSPVSKNYALYTNYRRSGFWDYEEDYTQYAYWPESFKEKSEDVWNTFMKAIADNREQQGTTFYINSLDGFYIDKNIPLSYTPYIAGRGDTYTDRNGRSQNFSYTAGGSAGNIAEYANDINDDFFQRIQRYGVTNIYGPMNVVLLDRVYQSEDGSDSGSRLPSTIINNNFRFPLITRPSTTNSLGGGGSSMGNGGNALQ